MENNFSNQRVQLYIATLGRLFLEQRKAHIDPQFSYFDLCIRGHGTLYNLLVTGSNARVYVNFSEKIPSDTIVLTISDSSPELHDYEQGYTPKNAPYIQIISSSTKDTLHFRIKGDPHKNYEVSITLDYHSIHTLNGNTFSGNNLIVDL